MSNLAKDIVYAILHDLTDRRGLKQEWNQIEGSTRDEICQAWETLTQKCLDKVSSDEATATALASIDVKQLTSSSLLVICLRPSK